MPIIFNPGSPVTLQGVLLELSGFINNTITTTNIDNQLPILVAIQQTLTNLHNIIIAYEMSFLLQQEYSLLINANGANLNLSVEESILISNRLIALNSFVSTVYPLPFLLTFNVSRLAIGHLAVPELDLLSYLMQFRYEAIQAGTTVSDLLAIAEQVTLAFQDLRDSIAVRGNSLEQASYDAVDRMYSCSQDVINLLINISPLASIDPAVAWNALIVLPTLLRVFGLLFYNPSSAVSQSLNAIIFTILKLISLTNSVIALFVAPKTVQQPLTETLRAGETLLDFAARTVGDYSQWPRIAAANSLVPPYIGTTRQAGIATPGQALFLPPFSDDSIPLGSYSNDFLGNDIDLGAPYTKLTQWVGDFTLIAGIDNYISAIERRLLTSLGSLIYDLDYGSLLPPQVGNISSANEAILLSAYLKSACLADPRTNLINKVTAYPVQFGGIVLTASLTPYGTQNASPLNLVIIPEKRTSS